MEMRMTSGSPRAALTTSSPRQLEVYDRQQWPRSLGEMLIVDQQDDLHDGALGATLREFLQPQVDYLVSALCATAPCFCKHTLAVPI